MSVDHYFLLGRSGLRVSRLALGTMNYGKAGFHAPFGKTEDEARPIFRSYLEAGGNFVDTADFYTAGQSEEILGRLISESGSRDRVVLTTKVSHNTDPGNPNAGGNGRKHVIRAVEDSLRRLGTDYIDLLLLHVWDTLTPAEEVVRTFEDLVRSGKVRYGGFSDVPGWYAARAQTYAEAHGLNPFVALQIPYSLLGREIEAEYVPLARNLGMGIMGWSPLGGGLLTGKYRTGDRGVTGDGRLGREGAVWTSPWQADERAWHIVGVLEEVAGGLGRSMAQTALNWAVTQPGMGAAVVGASSVGQLEGNIAALDFELPADARARLDEAAAVAPRTVYAMFTTAYQANGINTGSKVGDKPRGYAPPLWHG
ncbi:aldo/keto reductase [Streptomyces tremellae]|uniref:Aldo/keto reductase n=1 Tax=Streptomyces tremellae TaxID=1124239 RepID=A0ABP7G678_9ACTN